MNLIITLLSEEFETVGNAGIILQISTLIWPESLQFEGNSLEYSYSRSFFWNQANLDIRQEAG
jgi:hypothetical protein